MLVCTGERALQVGVCVSLCPRGLYLKGNDLKEVDDN